MGRKNPIEYLESSITTYHHRLLETPDAKDDEIEINIKSFHSIETALEHLREFSATARDPFALFAVAKHGLHLSNISNTQAKIKELLPNWLRACVIVGAYPDCIHFTNQCLASDAWGELKKTREGLALLTHRAKSLRNLGSFADALSCYRDAIDLAIKSGYQSDASIFLLLVGKLCGSYLGQRSLFSSLVEEAKSRLENELNSFSGPNNERIRLIHYIAICLDALGQAYSENDPVRAEQHYKEAFRLNWKIRRMNGMSRVRCHYNYLKFEKAKGNDRLQYVNGFNKGLKLLLNSSIDERGLGVRYVQYATMLNQINNNAEARRYLDRGKAIAKKYSDFKTLVRASVASADVLGSDRDLVTISLQEGQTIAKEYRLLLYEGELNRRIALLSDTRNSEINQVKLFERNREIFSHLVKEIEASLSRLNSKRNPEIEFTLLSDDTKQAFRDKLLLDYEHIVKQLDLNLRDLTAALSLNEGRRVDNELVHKDSHMDRTKDTCFILMPFSEPFNRYFSAVINPAVEAAGLQAIRADSLYGPTNVMQDIWDGIKKARVLIAELTTRNPNVMYELGIAHAMGKAVVLITQNINDVPFDLRTIRCIVYDTVNPDWASNLQQDITRFIEAVLKDVKKKKRFLPYAR